MKKDAFYFPHDSNAHHDPKLVSLLVHCDYFGIGIFWTLIEILRESTDYQYPFDYKMLEVALSHPQATFQATLEHCLKIGLLTVRDDFLSSPALTQRMKLIDQKREVLRQAGRRGYEIKAGLSHPKGRLKPPLSSKVKESKVKESNVIAAPMPQTPGPLTDIQKIVLCYKLVCGYPREDKAWDKLNFSRCSKSAKLLLDFMGNWKDAADCIEDIYEKFTAKGLTVTIETAVKHASEWKLNRSEKMERV